ncbi:pseudouridine synthase and archaeosine transglycosylase (PUA) domain-containing protein [Raphanus sativus]|nr:pseudouridine synthase and archaeosine transglycosylase (PUA) domain-containing protein [Raphanus sativus]
MLGFEYTYDDDILSEYLFRVMFGQSPSSINNFHCSLLQVVFQLHRPNLINLPKEITSHHPNMFKKFSMEEVSSQNQVKASVQRRIRQSIQEEYPGLETVLEDLLPKKSPLIVVKCPNHLTLVVVNNVPLFFCIRDGPYMPTLRLLHQYPNIMKRFQVDRGAIKFVFSGANIMCPGLTSPGGVLDEEVEAERPVAIYAEGKQHALAIGFTKMSAKDIKSINKGIGVDNMHYLNDGLWKMERLD